MNIANYNRTLEEVFKSIFHDKLKFEEFLKLDVKNEYQVFDIKGRKVYSPSKKLKKIHRFINGSIFEYADYNKNVVYSYLKGVSVRDAIEKHAKNNYFYRTDIKDFFGSITGENVIRSLENQLGNVPISDISNYVNHIFNLVVVNGRLPAGFSTSPILSNICLFSFDKELEVTCQRDDMVYTRYSDDMIISSINEIDEEKITGLIQSLLFRFVGDNVFLNDKKTKIHKKGTQGTLLGFNILPNGEVTIPSRDKKEIEILLHFYLSNSDSFVNYVSKNIQPRYANSDNKTLNEIGVSYLSGKLIGINAMDKKYLTKLRCKYGNTLIEMFLRKTVL
ncbi:TPA: reverse transcriptase domain-containing protein [Vibrio cholerae]|uniref:reverse transcriptase domain-containing protein n=1 Tax=Vibrio cholerae TaxID=666 RepID=UPI000BA940D8|nr:reverse transcriptase domain-containing protein [Vibrio cholerae]EGR1444982.1 RNA-directed DNA polymerase [Vibrio cholerae]EGR4152770.1 RNA-directed DNA polymerase [Vibrio cholerae]PAR79507.1 reverse transcriptase [Vibrio cholerae]GHX79841.1 DNA polymerase [Vibrio cholerae]